MQYHVRKLAKARSDSICTLLKLSSELLALYKEVQEQYESGRLEVPEDVTLLFADDNFGTIRRLPHGEEPKRKGGSGVRGTPILFVDIR